MPRLNDTLKNFPFISQELIETLDWAWLVDFGQGNFTQAKAMTEIALLGEWNTANLLARALVHQLQGEYSQALSLLEEAFLGESDSKNKLIITTIAYLTERKSKENLVDGCSISPTKTDTDTLWKEKTRPFKEEVKDLGCRLEINLIQQIASILPCWRATIIQQTDSELREQYKELILEQLTAQLELYQDKEYYAISEFFYCCFADLLALSGQLVAGWQLLENLAPVYSNSEKYLETAWYLMYQGDLIIETNSFGKAIVFGYRLIENNLDFSEIEIVDRSQIDSVTAQQKYLQARQYFAMTSALRGEAMTIMRLAYVNGLQKQWYLASCGYEEAEKAFLEMGDRLNSIAAEMGYLWSFAQYETLEPYLLEKLTESAIWMLKNKTVTFAISWLLAFTKAAREALPQEEGVVVSQRLIKIAEIIATKAIDLPLVFSSTVCSQLWQECHLAISNFYRHLAVSLAQQDEWELAFLATEKVKIFTIYSQTTKEDSLIGLEEKLNSIISLETISNSLPSNTVLLSFTIAPNNLLGWAITNQGLVKTNLIREVDFEEFKADNLEQTINIWLNNLLDSNADTEINKVLENIFLEPFSLEIEQKKHLLFTVCDRLQDLSFAALKYHYRINSNILKKEITLGEERSISYLSYASQISNCELIATATNKILIITENDDFIEMQQAEKSIDNSLFLSLSQGLSFAIGQIYGVSPFNNLTEINQEIIDLMDFQPIIHLFLAEDNNLLHNLSRQNITSELIILSIQDFKLRHLPAKELRNFTQNIIDAGAKTVVIIFDGEDSLATAILTYFFHQGLYFGQSIAESLRQSQKQIRLVTAQEALDFCYYLQHHVPWQTHKDRALKALITKYTGDIMVLGKDYSRAAEAYGAAIQILTDINYLAAAKSLESNYKMFKSLQKISRLFQEKRLIFDAPAYWSNVFIYGDWQLSFVDL